MATRNLTCSADARLLSPDQGAGACDHLPVGNYAGAIYRSVLKFSLNWTDVQQITKVELKIRKSSYYHVDPDNPTIEVRRVTSSWSEGTVGHPISGSNAVVYPGPSTTATGAATFTPGSADDQAWKTVDITTIAEAWAPASVLKSDGSPGGAQTNHGIRLASTAEGSDATAEFWSRETANDPYLVLTYISVGGGGSSQQPKWTQMSPLTVDDTTPSLTAQSLESSVVSYDLQVDSTTANGVQPDWSSLTYSVTNDTTGILGGGGLLGFETAITHTITTVLTRGQWYAVRIRTNNGSGDGPWSSTLFVYVNRIPTIGTRTPAAASLTYIHNLNEVAQWTGGGSHAKARFTFVYNDADGHAMSRRILRIYADSAGSPGSLLHTDDVSVTATAGSTVTVDSTYALVMGTQYHWSIEVYDGYESSGESSKTSFKVRWGQAIYEYNVGFGSSAWRFSAASMGVNEQSAFLFRTATGGSGSGAGAWTADIGSLNPSGVSYVNVLARVATTVSGTNVGLTDMTFTYLASQLPPENWTSSPAGEWATDPSVRRYGTQSFRCSVLAGTTGDRSLYPFRRVDGDDIPVIPGTRYTFSAFVRTNGALTGGAVKLRVHPGGTLGPVIIAETAGVTDTVSDTQSNESWRRLAVTFTVPAGVTTVRPAVIYVRTSGVTETFWVDATKFEEGTVASPWTPGFVADAVVLDAGGLAVDGLAGGLFRLRGTDGGTRDVVRLGPKGLVFGGDVEVYSSVADVLEVGANDSLKIGGGTLLLGSDVRFRRSGAAVATLDNALGGAAVFASTGQFRLGGVAFPSTPSVDDLFFRTDRDMWFRWDGTRWLSDELFVQNVPLLVATTVPITATATNRFYVANPWAELRDIWVERVACSFLVASGGTALSGSHKWVGTVAYDGPVSGSYATINIDSGSSNVWRTTSVTVNQTLASFAAYVLARITWTKTGTPGDLTPLVSVGYRVIG